MVKSNGNFFVTNDSVEMYNLLNLFVPGERGCVVDVLIDYIWYDYNGNICPYIMVVGDDFNYVSLICDTANNGIYYVCQSDIYGNIQFEQKYAEYEINDLIADVFDNGLCQTDDELILMDEFLNLF